MKRPTQPTALTRGDIWLVSLDPTIGSEIQKTRPCVIISPAEMHDHLRTVLVAPMTTGSHPAPFRIAIQFKGKQGLILLDQIRALDKIRLVRKLERVDAVTIDSTLKQLCEMFTI